VAALRAASREHVLTRDATELRRVVEALASQARQRGQRAEEAIVELKQFWADAPELAAIPATDRRALLDELVTLCIDVYYRTPNGRH
jgi:hypothetical protein